MVELNQEAPNVTLRRTDSNGSNRIFELKTAYDQGKTVLYFFPAAFSGVCTSSSCQLRDDIKEFESLNAQLFSISTDGPFTQAAFSKQNELNYPLLSDWKKEAIESFGIRDDAFANNLGGVAKRSLFLIEDGRITFKWVADSPGNFPPFDELKAKLEN